MRLGIYIDMRNPAHAERGWASLYGRWLERFEELDRLGLEAIWLTEHHFFDDGYLPQCWTLAAAIAARTSQARIGSAVTLLPLHDPLELAEQIALVDIISGGRVQAGFGVGYRKPEYEAFGGDFKRRYRIFGDRINELRSWWGETADGTRVISPRPLQQPVPLWGGFNGPMGARLAGRLGMGLQSLDHTLLEPYRQGLATAGHRVDSARMAGPVEVIVTDDPERSWNLLGPSVTHRWESYQRHMFQGTRAEVDPPAAPTSQQVRARVIIGTATEIADELRTRYAGLPVTDIMVWGEYPGMDDAAIDDHLLGLVTGLAPCLADD